MGNFLRRDFIWLKNNVSLQVNDLDIEDKGNIFDIYFDTVDVRKSILGMYAFYSHDVNKFIIDEFNEKATLVQCLALSGWLGKIRMFAPHQSELLNLIDIDFGIDKYTDHKRRIEEFFDEISFYDQTKIAVAIDKMNDEAINSFVRQQAGNAEYLFKSIQCIRHGNWQSRLKYLINNKLLRFDYFPHKYEEIFASELFYSINKLFEKRRPGMSRNNYADAAVLTILVYLLEKFKKGESNHIPLFYASTPIFCDVIKEANKEDLFIIAKEANNMILRNAEYFIYKCTFRPQPRLPKDIKKKITWKSEDLRSLNEELINISKASQMITPELLEGVRYNEKNILELIIDLKRYSFLENIWLRLLAEEDVRKAKYEIITESSKERFRAKIGEFVSKTKAKLKENVKSYLDLVAFYSKLNYASQEYITTRKEKSLQDIDVFKDFALIRFDFPDNSKQKIQDIVLALISTEEEANKDAIHAIFQHLFDITEEISEKNIINLSIVSAILWIARMDRVLIEKLGTLKERPHYSLNIVYAASIFRSGINISNGLDVIKNIENSYMSESNPKHKAGMAVGLGYLYFHLWLAMGNRPLWRNMKQVSIDKKHQEKNKLIENAIKYVSEAYGLLDHDPIKKAYALNQYLYYMVEGSDDSRIEEMGKVAAQLALYRENISLWNYRYDDTMARYFHRVSSYVEDIEEKKRLLDSALYHINQAISKNLGDIEIDNYMTQLSTERSNIIILLHQLP